MKTERPITFIVRAADGRVLDRFREDELACFASQPEKSWHEAACWAYVAVDQDRKLRKELRL